MLCPRRAPRCCLFLCLLLLVATYASSAEKLVFRPADPLNAVAFDHFYNMDYLHAISEFEQVL